MPGSVFISYSHADEVWKDRLVGHLGISVREGVLDLWDDGRIAAGTEWRSEIQQAIDVADVGVLLISVDFLTSDFIRGEEIPRMLERRSKNGMRLFPVLIRSCDWQIVSWLEPMQLRPAGGSPLAGFRGDRRDAEMVAIAREIRAFLPVESVPPSPGPAPTPTLPPTLHQLPSSPADFGLPGMGGVGKTTLQARPLIKWQGIALATLLMLGVLSAVVTLHKRSQLQVRRGIVLAENLARQARDATDPTTGLLLAVKAVGLARLPETEGALREALAGTIGRPMLGVGVKVVAASSNRRWMVALGNDGAVYRWDFTAQPSKAEILSFRIEEALSEAALSPDGRWLLINANGDLRLRDLQQGRVLELRESWAGGEPFSQDGHWLMTTYEARPVLRDLYDPSVPAYRYPDYPEVWPLTFSPTQSRSLAVAVDTGRIEPGRIERWEVGKEEPVIVRQELPDGRGQVASLAFSPDGRGLAVTSTGESSWAAKVWRLDQSPSRGKELQECKGNKQIAVGASGNWVFLWDGPAGSCLWSVETRRVSPLRDADVTTASFSSDGRWLAWGKKDGTAWLVDLKHPDIPAAALPAQAAPIRFVMFSQDGTWLILQGGNELPRRLDFQRKTAAEPPLLSVPPREILALTADGKQLAVGRSGQAIRVRSIDRGSLPLELQGSEPSTAPWVFSPQGDVLATGGSEGRLLLWLLSGESRSPRVATFEGGSIASLVFNPDGRWLAFGDDREAVWFWDVKTPGAVPYRAVRNPKPTALAFASGTRPLAAAWEHGEINLLPTAQDERFASISEDDRLPVTALEFDPKGERLAIAHSDHKISLRRPQDQVSEAVDLESQDGDVRLLRFSPDGRWLASGGTGGLVQLWALKEKEFERTPIVWHAHFGMVQTLAFENQRLVTAGVDGTVRRWELTLEKLKESACKAANRNFTKAEWKQYALEGPFEKDEPCGPHP